MSNFSFIRYINNSYLITERRTGISFLRSFANEAQLNLYLDILDQLDIDINSANVDKNGSKKHH